MTVCIIGNGLTSLLLAKNLVDKKIPVDIYFKVKNISISKIRTIGISKDNSNFLIKNGINIKKIGWPILDIKIFEDSKKNIEILNFKHNEIERFLMFKNYELYKKIENSLIKKKNYKKKIIKKNSFYSKIINDDKYEIIINTEKKNYLTNKYFYKKIKKEYDGIAITTIINHNSCKNNTAFQIFTKMGPLAFLPISKNKTSLVFSLYKNKNFQNENEIKNIIFKYNKYYKIKSFSKFEKANLEFTMSRNYYYKNILNFGDNLHRVHPLAGQGFNMNIRDIKILSKIIDDNLKLGLELNESVLKKFQEKNKHLNFLFGSSLDIIHEVFKFNNKINNQYSKRIFNFIKSSRIINTYATKIADKGIII
tara:strand:+ start:182 stop:1276 length:1095 start_codon:yes stop_codon:yes gene_type:complete